MTELPQLLRMVFGGLLLAAGLASCGIGVLALFRFKRFPERLLSCSATDTAGLTLILAGAMIVRGWDAATWKIGLVLTICLLIHPLVTMELARCHQEQDE